MDPTEAGAHLYSAYMAAHNEYVNDAAGTAGLHPSKDVGRWRSVAAGGPVEDVGGLGPVEIQDKNKAQDDQQPAETGGIAGEHPTVDGVLSSDSQSKPVFTFADGRVVVGDAALVASARCSNPDRVRAMEKLIPALKRLK